MSDIAVSVEHLSKQYQLGGKQAAYQTFRDAIIAGATAPLRWLRGERQEQNTFWALNDVSFKIKHGEAVGIIGRNGAGKSTLLKILSSITAPTRGRVELFGRVGSLLEVGTGFHPELSGRENIFLNGAILGMSRNEITHKFDEIVDFAEVEKFLDTPVKHYSSGMYVKLAFAVAAHLEPEILVVDEVLAVGDAAFQKKSLGKMEEVARGGRTVLFVSHNLQMVKTLCQSGILIDAGKLIYNGGIEDTVTKYLLQMTNKQKTELHSVRKNEAYIANVDAMLEPKGDDLDCALSLKFQIICDRKIEELSLGFALHDEQGTTVSLSYSGPTSLFSLDKGIYIITARIDQFPMTPGLYTVRARMEAKGIEVDWPRGDLTEFTIEMPKHLFGHRAETLVNGRLLTRPKWLIEKS